MLSSHVIKISPQFHNCAFHSIIPYIATFISPKSTHTADFQFNELSVTSGSKAQFRNTQGYTYFLEAFNEYYQIEDSAKAEEYLINLVEKFTHPLDLQVLLGPVLRATLKKCMVSSTYHKEGIKESFIGLISQCKNKSRKLSANQRRNENYIRSWLKSIEWGPEDEYDELFKPNIDVIAKLLTQGNASVKNYWGEIYQNYVNFVGDQRKGVFVSQDLVNLICENFNFVPLVNTLFSPEMNNSLANISLSNDTRDHWELKNQHNSRWDFTEHSEKSAFKRYHDFSVELFSSGNNEELVGALQNTFKEKINKFITSDEAYVEEMYTTLPSNNWAKNSVAQGVVDFVVDTVLENQKHFITQSRRKFYFIETPEFKDFLSHFKQYYGLNPKLSHKDTLAQLKQLLLSYPTPDERFMLLSPVLRKMIKGDEVESELTYQDLVTLCRGFRLGLDVYFSNGADEVHCYQKHKSHFNERANFATLSVVATNTGLRYLQRSDLSSYQRKVILESHSSHAFEQKNATLQVDLEALQNGISTSLRTGILFVQPKEGNNQLNRGIVTKNLPPLHAAVIAQDNAAVKNLLQNGSDWRAKYPWQVTDKSLIVTPKLISPKVSALALAASLNNVAITNLILEQANSESDEALVQEAYNVACNFRHSSVLYCFLPVDTIEHTYQAVLNAALHKDLFLLSELAKLGAPIIQANVTDSQLLALSFDYAKKFPEDSQFTLAFHNLIFSLAHDKRLRNAHINMNAFKIDEKGLKVIEAAFDHSLGSWVSNVIELNSSLPTLYKDDQLKDICGSNFDKILEIVAKAACKAVEQRDESKLKGCFQAEQRCLIYPGKFNPLHFALLTESYDFVFDTFVEHVVNTIESAQGELTEGAKNSIEVSMQEQFKKMAEKAYDEYDRTLSFRLERIEYKKSLHAQLANSPSFFNSLKTRGALLRFSLNEGRIYVVDGYHKKTKHTAKINSKAITKIGYPAMLFARSLGTLANGGLLRFGIDFTWSFMPNALKYPLVKIAQKTAGAVGPYVGANAETAGTYAGIITDNVVSCALMPGFYVASTVLSNGVYFAFKDSGYDNLEAIAALAADGAAFSLANGSGNNYEIDERYNFHLTRNLTPFFGEWASSNYLVPVIGTIDGISNQINFAVNYPITALSPYFSANTLAHISESLGGPTIRLDDFSLPEQLQFLQDSAKTGVSYFQSFLKFKRHQEERIFAYVEGEALGFMENSPYKTDRLHALQIFKVSQISLSVDELKQSIEKLKQETVPNNDAIESAEKALAEQTAALDVAIEREDVLFKQTQGYPYYETWQEKHMAMKYGEVDKSLGASQLETLKNEEQQAREQSSFYNNESVNRASQSWAKSVGDLFNKHRDNFPDSTNIAGFVENIVNNVFNGFTDRNKMAQFAADEIIRTKYPFYPDMGDPSVIEAERLKYVQEISTNELSGYKRNPDRAQDRLYNYVLAIITNTEKPKHVHTWENIVKPFANEILGKTIGYVPFKDFKGGRVQPGNVGLQINKQIAGASSFQITLADTPVVTLYDSNKRKPKIVVSGQDASQLQKPKSLGGSVSTNHALHNTQVEDAEGRSNPALDLNNPIMVDILAEQFEKVFATVNNLKIPELKTSSNIRSSDKTKAPVAQKPMTRSQTAPKPVNPPIVSYPVKKVQKATTPEQKQNWWRLAFRSARGENSAEIRAWKRSNVKSSPKWLIDLTQGVSDSAIPVSELPEIFKVAAKESFVELIDGVVSLGHFAASELKHAVKGEDLQTRKAISLLAVFIGEEAARVSLKEQTKTSKFVKELAAEFDSMDKKERVKAVAKLAISIAVPVVGAAKVTRLAPAAQKIAVSAAPAATAARYPLRSAAKTLNPNTIPKQQVDKLNTLLSVGPKKWAQQAFKVDVPATKSLAPQYALRSKDYISVNGVNRPIKAQFVGEFNLHKTPKVNIDPNSAKSFMGATYKSYILDQDISLYRVGYSKGKNISDFYTFDKITSEILARIDNAILPVWPTGGRSIVDVCYKVRIPKGTTIHIGQSAPQGGIFLGGTTQVYIEEAIKIKGITVLEKSSLKQELLWNLKAKK